jgi:hypothetical protein
MFKFCTCTWGIKKGVVTWRRDRDCSLHGDKARKEARDAL